MNKALNPSTNVPRRAPTADGQSLWSRTRCAHSGQKRGNACRKRVVLVFEEVTVKKKD